MRKPTQLDKLEGLEALIVRVAGGDKKALKAVYRITGGRLYWVLLAEHNDEAVADALLEDIFVSVWSDAGSFDPTTQTAWKWLCNLALRRRCRRLH